MTKTALSMLCAVVLFAAACDDALLGQPSDPKGGLVYTPDWDGVTAMAGDHCQVCHAPGGSADYLPLPGAVQLDLHLGAGELVVPFDPEASKLWRLIGGELAESDPGDMPLGGRISKNQVDHVRLWILDGAPYPPLVIDNDQDGVSTADGDCEDADPAIFPGAVEVCDGVDNDCDGVVDGPSADGASSWFPDLDGDGFGDVNGEVVACNPPAGHVPTGGDCDDGSISVHPGAPEPDCTDPVDYNCDGVAGAVDGDLDGFWACEECNDADAQVFPGAVERCDGQDGDCDGTVDEDAVDAVLWYPDGDGDGHGASGAVGVASCAAPFVGWVQSDDDCNDANATVSPSATELCTGIDNDCNGLVDDNAADQGAWYPDADGDGFGDDGAAATLACTAPVGTVANSGDCNDSDPAFNPGALETDCLDPTDYNCDGVTGAVDGDGDGFFACEECNDGDAAISPAGVELCDGVDNDCSGVVDDAPVDGVLWYPDGDGDGHGDAGDPGTLACSAPQPGWRSVADDCDDANALVNPSAPERCNGVDDDCNGPVDDSAIDAFTWYVDGDGDGDGTGAAILDCDPALAGHGSTNGDCDDADPLVNSFATEVCDGTDNDCSGAVDDGAVDASTHTLDGDGDGFGDDADPGVVDCAASLPGRVTSGGDCDDADPAIHPAATETCDGVDNDCTGLIDDNAVDAGLWFDDLDGDGFGDELDPGVLACTQPVGTVADATDCDDGDATVNPAVTFDGQNGVDDDCDGLVDEDGNAPSHAVDVQPIWDANCLGACHAPPVAASGMDLTNGYLVLVNVPSDDVPTMDRVEPGDSANSYLWHKLSGTQASVGGTGNQMPATAGGPFGGGGSLSAGELALIQLWIDTGALP